MKTINATFFIKPNGKKVPSECKNVYPDDADYININNILVSMEELEPDNIAIYFDYGKVDVDGEPDELIELSFGRSCEETIKSGVERIKELKLNG